jgi:hypothetical protein
VNEYLGGTKLQNGWLTFSTDRISAGGYFISSHHLLRVALSFNMTRKRLREHSTSPTQRIVWSHKRTRRGAVLTATVVSGSQPLGTPARPKERYTSPPRPKGQRPPISKGIKEALSLPPIPAPDILAPKRDRRGKV